MKSLEQHTQDTLRRNEVARQLEPLRQSITLYLKDALFCLNQREADIVVVKQRIMAALRELNK